MLTDIIACALLKVARIKDSSNMHNRVYRRCKGFYIIETSANYV